MPRNLITECHVIYKTCSLVGQYAGKEVTSPNQWGLLRFFCRTGGLLASGSNVSSTVLILGAASADGLTTPSRTARTAWGAGHRGRGHRLGSGIAGRMTEGWLKMRDRWGHWRRMLHLLVYLFWCGRALRDLPWPTDNIQCHSNNTAHLWGWQRLLEVKPEPILLAAVTV